VQNHNIFQLIHNSFMIMIYFKYMFFRDYLWKYENYILKNYFHNDNYEHITPKFKYLNEKLFSYKLFLILSFFYFFVI